ncbi:cadherin-like domain-containing protein [Microvirga sp. SM9]|nr:cadherin-like domain-containing protein [Microvirga lenta]
MRELLGDWAAAPTAGDLEAQIAFDDGNILLGGGGSDVIEGRGGNDVIDGDSWLNVRIRITHEGQTYTTEGMAQKVYLETDFVEGVLVEGAVAQFGGKTLDALMLDRTLNPGQLSIVREIVKDDGVGDTDVAVYWDVVDNYSFARNADGSVIVSHTGFDQGDVPAGSNLVSDGVDKLRNIEKLRFSDGNGGTVEYNIDELFNRPATGVPVISDTSPTEGQVLTVNTSGIQDLNGLGAFSYQWQSSANGTAWTDIAGATGATFTPQDLPGTAFGAQAGLQLRVVVSFTDGRGNPESVTSAATRPVGVNWDGNFASNNTLNGTAGDDIGEGVGPFFFFGGNDVLNGNGGDDLLDGAGGNDVLNGGTGNDVLVGGGGTDAAVFSGPVGNYSFALNGTNLVVTDNVGTDGTDTLSGIEDLRFGAQELSLIQGTNGNNNQLIGSAGADLVLGFDGNDNIDAGLGNDVILAGNGNDTINWDANAFGATDGRDIIDGGAGEDTFDIDGRAGAETFRVYTRAAAVAAGMTGLAENTEIVITRNGTNNASIVAELDNIEEIMIGTRSVAVPGGPAGGGAGGGDTVQIIGDFTQTSLNFNTITIDGDEGDDTVDISGLTSAHRIVFRSNGGNDTIVGTLRAQDVIELPPGMKPEDFTSTGNDDGTVTLASANHRITYMGSGTPIIRECTAEPPVQNPDETGELIAKDDSFTIKKGEVLTLTAAALLGNDVAPEGAQLVLRSVDEDEHGEVVLNEDGTITFTPKAGFTGYASFTYLMMDGQGSYDEGKVLIKVEKATSDPITPPAEQPPVEQPPVEQPPVEQPLPANPPAPVDMVVRGGRGHDRLHGDDGNDQLYGNSGNDRLYGHNGNDRLYGNNGNDRLYGDEGVDRMWGGRGNDTYEVDHRQDRAYESRGQGIDTVKASVSYSLSAHVEKLTLTGAANISGTGNGLNNSLTGNSGDNSLKGGSGHDTLKGMSGDDKLFGQRGNDKLLGGAGDDMLKGGGGDDRLTGNSGQDVFIFERNGGRDTVTDFRDGDDRLDVSRLSGVESMSDLNVWQMGSDVMIWRGSDILILKGVNASDLDNSDFIF